MLTIVAFLLIQNTKSAYSQSKYFMPLIIIILTICNISGSPKIIPFSFPPMADIDMPFISVSCVSSKGAKPITFEWLKNGKTITGIEKSLTIRNEAMFSVLEIRDLILDHVGNYTCLAKNSFGSDQFTSSLVIRCKLFTQFVFLIND